MKGIFFCIAVFCMQLTYGQERLVDKLEQLMNNRRYYEVLRSIDTLSGERQEASGFYSYLIKANEGLMRYNDAYRYAKRWFIRDTANRDARLTMARLANSAGHKSEALRLYEQLASEDSLDFSINYALGRLYQQHNRSGSALEVYLRQLSVDSTNVTLLTLIGDCFVDMELISSAMPYYGKAFYEDVLNASLAIKATNVILTHKDYIPYYGESLSRMLDTALLQAPKAFPLLQTLGVLKYTDKKYPESEQIFTRLQKEGDSSRITLKYAGLVKFQQNNFKSALPFLSKAYALYLGADGQPTDIDLAMKYGEVLCRTGFCADALYVFQNIERTVQPDQRFLSLLEVMKGMSYTYIGREDKAIEAYWKAYRLNPGNNRAIANFAYLTGKQSRKTENLTEIDKKKIRFAQVLFLQKMKEKSNGGIETQQEDSRNMLREALEELFFKNENTLVTLDPEGKEHVYSIEDIRKLVREAKK